MSRYQKLPSKEKGLFKDTVTGSYYAVKYDNGKKFTKTFSDLKQARKWRDSSKSHKIELFLDYDAELNGSKPFTFIQAWEKYRKIEFPKLEQSTIEVKEERCKFFDDLLNVKMVHMNPDFIDDYIIMKKKVIMETMKANRFSLKNELIELSAVFGFYRKHMDYRFVNPIIKDRHWPLGVIKEKPKTNKKMDEHEISQFFAGMWKVNEDNGMFAMLAENQFLIAGRIQEASAIKVSKINFKTDTLIVDEAISWHTKTKTFSYFKGTKTNKDRYPHITERMKRNFKILISRLPHGCDLLHNRDGRPLHYYEIYKAYRRGLREAGLHKKYSATHIMRHSMAKQARVAMGSLDGAQAMGGWASQKQCEVYADSPSHMQIEASQRVERTLKLVN